jgi:hypothetical protein
MADDLKLLKGEQEIDADIFSKLKKRARGFEVPEEMPEDTSELHQMMNVLNQVHMMDKTKETPGGKYFYDQEFGDKRDQVREMLGRTEPERAIASEDPSRFKQLLDLFKNRQ